MRFSAADSSKTAHPLTDAVRADWPFLVRGPAVVYQPTTARSLGELLLPHRTSLHAQNLYNKDWPLSADAPVGPAILLNQIGGDRC